MPNFWSTLTAPFTVLAPMDDVTDVVFREIMATELPSPDVFFTEFTSVDGLQSAGRTVSARKLRLTENQRPVVAQIWGTKPEHFKESAKFIAELGFDGIDINMGCPVPAVIKHCAGAGMIKTPEQAAKVIAATREGAPDLALSVKTRLGYDKIDTEAWTTLLLNQHIDALTIHGRTAVQMSKGEADWNEIGKVVKIRDRIAPHTKIIGNGDIESYAQAVEMHKLHNVDGVMIGRGVFHNPWVFEKTTEHKHHEPSEYVAVLRKHLVLFVREWGKTKNFEIMKKFFKMYIKEFDGASQLRQNLMECKTPNDVEKALEEYATTLSA